MNKLRSEMTHLEKMRELRRLVCYERAGFERYGGDPDTPLPTRECEVTAFIRERTRLHRETYILPIIDELIAKAEREQDRRRTRARRR